MIGGIMKELIENVLKSNIESTNNLYKLLERMNLLNEQYVLDWLDKLNEISVRQ